ncbi:MAG: aminoacyl-tRNA hydrolase [Proteobacteria bacterium]|nr:aminoacyl-tRNA hydrolase [Pseudomonadota bacterium]
MSDTSKSALPRVQRLIVGLGNPGPEYEWTRHNVGFHVVERIAKERGAFFESARRLEGYTGPNTFRWARLDDPAALLVKPETFMNLSGKVVGPLARFVAESSGRLVEAAEPRVLDGAESDADAEAEAEAVALAANVFVVYDDMDLDLGRLRIRPHGGAGGQKGMRSIIEHLGTNRVPRLRVGIGRPGTDAVRHVLERFSPKDQVEIEISVAEASEAILDWLESGDLDKCMARFHSRWNQDS